MDSKRLKATPVLVVAALLLFPSGCSTETQTRVTPSSPAVETAPASAPEPTPEELKKVEERKLADTKNTENAAILGSLNMDDVRDRCGKPDREEVGLVSYYSYDLPLGTIAPETADVTIWFKVHNGVVYIASADYTPIRSNHPRQNISNADLLEALPCLLKGGLAK